MGVGSADQLASATAPITIRVGDRFWLKREVGLRDRALFDLAIDSKLRGCDLVKVRLGDLVSGGRICGRAMVIQQKTGRPV